jgi:hypothetical protein
VRLTPRKNEYAQVVKLLESDAYDSAEALAKDIIKTVADFLDDREWYALAWRDKLGPDALSLAWGVFPSEVEARRFGEALAVGGHAQAVKLYSASEMVARSKEADDLVGRSLCKNCGHPHGAHQHERRMGQCQVDRCGCKKDTQ